MKKILAITAIALLAASCNSQQANNQDNNQNSQGNQQQSQGQQQGQQGQSLTYKNQTYGFEFQYPDSYEFVTPNYANLQDKVVQVQTARDAYPNTNFADAAFSVSAQYATSLANCLALNPPAGSDGFKTKVTINGQDFYMTKSMGAAAGNLYAENVYRTLTAAGKLCVELNETIHTANIGNFPQGSVTEVDKAPIQQQLDSMLNSFKFDQQ